LASQAFQVTSNPEVEVQRRRAFRALLRNPLLPATGETADEYILIRRHAKWLKQWLARFPDWTLHIDGDVARLRKIPADLLDETRPAIDRISGTTFTKRRYVLLCLALAALEQADRQTTLDQVAQAITKFAAADRDIQAAGLFFDPWNYDQRRDLVHAVRFLVNMGVLRRLDGEERQFQDGMNSSDVLYDINSHVLAATLQGSLSPSMIENTDRQSIRSKTSRGGAFAERAAKLSHQPIPATEEERCQWIRSRLVRALLDDPVLYFQDLNDEERKYLEKHRGYLLREIGIATGLIAEVRREGIAMVDEVGDLSDQLALNQGMDDHLSLLLVQWLAECSRSGAGVFIPLSKVEERVRELIHVHGSEFYNDGCETGAEIRLTEDALLRLQALRLIQLTAGGVVPLAASGRFAAAE